MTNYYVKPLSLTWNVAAAMIVAGLFLAALPVHGMADWAAFIEGATNETPAELIIKGLSLIGLRAAVGDAMGKNL